jgi:hypothetical protein
MKNLPRKNDKAGGIGFLLVAATSGGAAIAFAKSSQPGLALDWVAIAMVEVVIAVFFLKRSRQP